MVVVYDGHTSRCVRWSQEKGLLIILTEHGVEASTGVSFLFFFARTKPIWMHFYCALCIIQRPSQIFLCSHTPGVVTTCSWTPRELLFPLPTPAWIEVKSPLRSCQMCGEGRKNTPSSQTPLFLCTPQNCHHVLREIVQMVNENVGVQHLFPQVYFPNRPT
jgi:hypothetical protein